MATQRSIIDALIQCSAAGESVVLATVVRVTGSSYGGVGARMVVRIDGSTIGIVSGGCLETDLAVHAHEVHETGIAKVVTYDTRADDDAAWGLGLGCNGLIDVLLEPLDPNAARQMATILGHALDSSHSTVLVSVVESNGKERIGSHALIGDEVEAVGDWADDAALEAAIRDSTQAFEERRRGLVREYGPATVAFEVIEPAVRLMICGSGPDVVPLVRFAVELGWTTTVVDHRSLEHAHPERFPGARVIECADPVSLSQVGTLTPRTAAVVMSHHFARDVGYVRALMESNAAYIGVLGPRARFERMMSEMKSTGDETPRTERVYAPVGLDIGGEGPDAIALAIIAEVSAVMSDRSGGHLRDQATLHTSSNATKAERA